MIELITEALKRKDIAPLLIFPKELMSSREIEWIEWIVEYTARFHEAPSLERFLISYPTFVSVSSRFPLEDIYLTALQEKRNLFARSYLMRNQEALRDGDDPQAMILELAAVLQLGSSDLLTIGQVDRTKYMDGKSLIPWGIRSLDKAAGGFVDGDLAYLFGRPGSYKSTFAEARAHFWWKLGKRVLYASNENPATEVIAKIDALIAGFNPMMRRTGGWTERDRVKLSAVNYVTAGHEGEVIVPKRKIERPSQLEALIQSSQADVVIVDGVYLMQPDSSYSASWEKNSKVSQALKQVALATGCPILGITQANKEAEGKKAARDNVAYSDSYLQDADLLMGINSFGSDNDASVVEILKNRWGPKGGFMLEVNFEDMYVSERMAHIIEDEVEW